MAKKIKVYIAELCNDDELVIREKPALLPGLPHAGDHIFLPNPEHGPDTASRTPSHTAWTVLFVNIWLDSNGPVLKTNDVVVVVTPHLKFKDS